MLLELVLVVQVSVALLGVVIRVEVGGADHLQALDRKHLVLGFVVFEDSAEVPVTPI